MPTFAELYCERHGIPAGKFSSSLFWRCVHRRAWICVPFLRLISRDYFLPDFDLIRGVGRITEAKGLTEELADFHSHPNNLGFLRRRLKLRISVGAIVREVHLLMPGRAPATFYDLRKPGTAELPVPAAPAQPSRHSASN